MSTRLDTRVTWLGLPLDNPLILASMTPISHKRIKEHVLFYTEAAKRGIGAIVLESCVPNKFGNKDTVFTQHDLLPIETGLAENQYMGFSILGPPYPNLSSVKYGKELALNLRDKISIPIIGSIITNFNEGEKIVNAAIELAQSGVNAIELNFSCPNILLFKNSNKSLPPIDVIKLIKKETKLKVSLKVVPQFDFNSLIESGVYQCIDGITYANAYLALVPPNINKNFGNPFGRGEEWAFTGVYGPFERLLTYRETVKFKKTPIFKKIELSLVGGLVHEKHVIEALLLGANTVQLSSGIAWKGLDLIEDAICFLNLFMKKNNFNSIDDFRGKSLAKIKNGADDLIDYKASAFYRSKNQRKTIYITELCQKCYRCLDNVCLALKKNNDGSVSVIQELCTGCGWCEFICPYNGAIKRNLIGLRNKEKEK